MPRLSSFYPYIYSSIKWSLCGCCTELLCPALSLLVFSLISHCIWGFWIPLFNIFSSGTPLLHFSFVFFLCLHGFSLYSVSLSFQHNNLHVQSFACNLSLPRLASQLTSLPCLGQSSSISTTSKVSPWSPFFGTIQNFTVLLLAPEIWQSYFEFSFLFYLCPNISSSSVKSLSVSLSVAWRRKVIFLTVTGVLCRVL